MSDLTITKVNEVFSKIDGDVSILFELKDYFSFRPHNYKFQPAYKKRIWDGYIRLINISKKQIHNGLIQPLLDYCRERNYTVDVDPLLIQTRSIPDNYGHLLAKQIGLNFEPRWYQNDYVVHCLRHKRAFIQSPTSSGKSLIFYLLSKHHQLIDGFRGLIIVPRVQLVEQMAGDFVDYGCDKNDIYTIKAGVDKNTITQHFVISTWQSIHNQPPEWFQQFGYVIGDEAHGFEGNCLKKLMEKMTTVGNRYAATGSVASDSKVHRLTIESLFGPHFELVKTKDLIDDGTVASFQVKGVVFKYDEHLKRDLRNALTGVTKKLRYQHELNFINGLHERNAMLVKLISSFRNENTLVLIDRIEKHGDVLYKLFQNIPNIKLHYIHGSVDTRIRESVRHLIENDPEKNHVIIASYGVFSTGINLKRLDNVVFAAGSKAENRVIQSIGRVLRKGNGSDEATLYDIADDFGHNHCLKHFIERLKIYKNEGHPITFFEFPVKKSTSL